MPASQAGRRRFEPGHPLQPLRGPVGPCRDSVVRCPTCKKDFEADSSAALPFCSERCRLSDLGKWLNEEYRIPGEPAAVAEQSDEDTLSTGEREPEG